MNVINKLNKRREYDVYKPFTYTEMVRKSYSSGSICGGVLAGKTVLVTGATGGIGVALAQRFLTESTTVYLAGRNEEKLVSLCDKLGDIYKKDCINYIIINNLDIDDMRKKIAKLFQTTKIDFLINNSGIYTDVDKKRELRNINKEQFSLDWETNYVATKEMTYITANYMSKMGGGHIINVSSICAESPKYKYTPYGISKSAIMGLKSEIENKYEGVSVTSILPGTVATRMNNASFGDNITMSRNRVFRAALPEEIAAIVAWTCSIKDILISSNITASACEVL